MFRVAGLWDEYGGENPSGATLAISYPVCRWENRMLPLNEILSILFHPMVIESRVYGSASTKLYFLCTLSKFVFLCLLLVQAYLGHLGLCIKATFIILTEFILLNFLGFFSYIMAKPTLDFILNSWHPCSFSPSGCVLPFEEVTSRTFASLQSSCRHSCDMHKVLQEATERFRTRHCNLLLRAEYQDDTDRASAAKPQRSCENWIRKEILLRGQSLPHFAAALVWRLLFVRWPVHRLVWH